MDNQKTDDAFDAMFKFKIGEVARHAAILVPGAVLQILARRISFVTNGHEISYICRAVHDSGTICHGAFEALECEIVKHQQEN